MGLHSISLIPPSASWTGPQSLGLFTQRPTPQLLLQTAPPAGLPSPPHAGCGTARQLSSFLSPLQPHSLSSGRFCTLSSPVSLCIRGLSVPTAPAQPRVMWISSHPAPSPKPPAASRPAPQTRAQAKPVLARPSHTRALTHRHCSRLTDTAMASRTRTQPSHAHSHTRSHAHAHTPSTEARAGLPSRTGAADASLRGRCWGGQVGSAQGYQQARELHGGRDGHALPPCLSLSLSDSPTHLAQCKAHSRFFTGRFSNEQPCAALAETYMRTRERIATAPLRPKSSSRPH